VYPQIKTMAADQRLQMDWPRTSVASHLFIDR